VAVVVVVWQPVTNATVPISSNSSLIKFVFIWLQFPGYSAWFWHQTSAFPISIDRPVNKTLQKLYGKSEIRI